MLMRAVSENDHCFTNAACPECSDFHCVDTLIGVPSKISSRQVDIIFVLRTSKSKVHIATLKDLERSFDSMRKQLKERLKNRSNPARSDITVEVGV